MYTIKWEALKGPKEMTKELMQHLKRCLLWSRASVPDNIIIPSIFKEFEDLSLYWQLRVSSSHHHACARPMHVHICLSLKSNIIYYNNITEKRCPHSLLLFSSAKISNSTLNWLGRAKNEKGQGMSESISTFRFFKNLLHML